MVKWSGGRITCINYGSEESRESEEYMYTTKYLQYTSTTTRNLWLQTFQLHNKSDTQFSRVSNLCWNHHGLVQYCDHILSYKVAFAQLCYFPRHYNVTYDDSIVASCKCVLVNTFGTYCKCIFVNTFGTYCKCVLVNRFGTYCKRVCVLW